jgi:two-component system, NtrC family, sensor kinase
MGIGIDARLPHAFGRAPSVESAILDCYPDSGRLGRSRWLGPCLVRAEPEESCRTTDLWARPPNMSMALAPKIPLSPLEPADRIIPDLMGSAERTRRFDRQAAWEHLASYLAHHLGSPLNVVAGRATMLASGELTQADVKRNARIIEEQAARMAQFLREVIAFAQREPRQGTVVDFAELTRTAVSMLGPMARAHLATIAVEDEGDAITVHGNPDTLLVALTHVLENGIRATPEGGILRISLRQEARPESLDGNNEPGVPFVCLDVEDEGPGIQAEVLPRLFKPFTTTHGAREATGLGLFIAQAIAKEHGGWIEGVNKDDRGARFTLHLPQGHAHDQ